MLSKRSTSMGSLSKWFSIECLLLPVISSKYRSPCSTISSTTYCTTGFLPTGSISFGCDFVAGSNRVPRPATGITTLLILMTMPSCVTGLLQYADTCEKRLQKTDKNGLSAMAQHSLAAPFANDDEVVLYRGCEFCAPQLPVPIPAYWPCSAEAPPGHAARSFRKSAHSLLSLPRFHAGETPHDTVDLSEDG
ncbi:MAG: hypothetical protein BWY06_03361 [Candidatus Latescibacteria bacterium ADurb.Bin168]|nr:MAG: hypothetical protein BWY06_03361 [Candidatus Latescibacteria bacterium ADurb.Bin168]